MTGRRKPDDRLTSFEAMGQKMGHQPHPPPGQRGDRARGSYGPGQGGRGGSSPGAPDHHSRHARQQPAWIDGYLNDGYFKKGDDGRDHLRVELVTSTARAIADYIARDARPQMRTHQVRRFFTYVRALDGGLQNGASFDSVVPRIAQLEPAAANAVTRGLAPREFQFFIERNAREARKHPENFLEGFVPHFESVIAFLPKEGGRS